MSVSSILFFMRTYPRLLDKHKMNSSYVVFFLLQLRSHLSNITTCTYFTEACKRKILLKFDQRRDGIPDDKSNINSCLFMDVHHAAHCFDPNTAQKASCKSYNRMRQRIKNRNSFLTQDPINKTRLENIIGVSYRIINPQWKAILNNKMMKRTYQGTEEARCFVYNTIPRKLKFDNTR